MPNVEVGVVGGGTVLAAQRACLRVADAAQASDLATLVCAAVLAGELSLLAALSTNTLVAAHLRMNR